MVVIGTDGMIVLDDVQQGAEKLLLYSHEVGWEGEIQLSTRQKEPHCRMTKMNPSDASANISSNA